MVSRSDVVLLVSWPLDFDAVLLFVSIKLCLADKKLVTSQQNTRKKEEQEE